MMIATDRNLIDAFAVARGTWDDLVTLQPDIRAAQGPLTPDELDELSRRVAAHRAAVGSLFDALESVAPGTGR